MPRDSPEISLGEPCEHDFSEIHLGLNVTPFSSLIIRNTMATFWSLWMMTV